MRLAGAILLLVAGGSASAQSPVELAYSDKLLPSAPIGLTGVLVGLVRQPFPAGPDEAELWVEVPPGWAETQLCVRTLSSDARYSGLGRATLPAGASGPTPLRIDREALRETGGYPDVLAEKAAQGSLAVLVQQGDCVERPAEGAGTAVARLSAAEAGNTVLAFVNSANADRVTARIVGGDGQPLMRAGDCSRVQHDAGVAYDHVCVLDLAEAKGQGGKLVIERIRGGNPDERPVRTPVVFEAGR